MIDLQSSRADALVSHNFLVMSHVRLNVPRIAAQKKKAQFDARICRDHSIALHFAHQYDTLIQQLADWRHLNSCNIDSLDKSMEEAFDHAS